MPATHWTLFVDESGSFARGHADALAAGLLVEAPWTPALERKLARRLAAIAPGVVSPLHAWTLKSAEKFARAIESGAVELDATTARAVRREDAEQIAARLAGYRAGLEATLAGLSGDVGARVVVVGAACDVSGRRRPSQYGQVRADAYVEALAALLARVVLLVREANADVVVSTFVATRDVVVDALGVGTDINPALLSQIASAVKQQFPSEYRVQFVAERVERYDGKRAGVVLADTVSNSYFVAACERRLRDWPSVHQHAVACWALGAELSTPATRDSPLPTFAAAGWAHDALVAVANGDNPEWTEGGTRAWIGQQAAAWIEALR